MFDHQGVQSFVIICHDIWMSAISRSSSCGLSVRVCPTMRWKWVAYFHTNLNGLCEGDVFFGNIRSLISLRFTVKHQHLEGLRGWWLSQFMPLVLWHGYGSIPFNTYKCNAYQFLVGWTSTVPSYFDVPVSWSSFGRLVSPQEKNMPCTQGLDGIFGIAFRPQEPLFRRASWKGREFTVHISACLSLSLYVYMYIGFIFIDMIYTQM